MNQNMTAAQAAQQDNRDNGGKYATKKHGEVSAYLTTTTAAPVGACPGCGENMVGCVGDGGFVPGASCDHCQFEVPSRPLSERHELFVHGYVRVTGETKDIAQWVEPGDPNWAGLVASHGYDPDALQRATFAVADPEGYIKAETERNGYAHLGDVYSVILDREQVSYADVVERVGDLDAMHDDDQIMEVAIDQMYAEATHEDGDDAYEVSDERLAEVREHCRVAGLAVMSGIYESMANRGILHRDQPANADTVTDDYFTQVAPRVDRVEDTF